MENWRNTNLDSPYNDYDSVREEKIAEYIGKYGLPDDFDEYIHAEMEDEPDYLMEC